MKDEQVNEGRRGKRVTEQSQQFQKLQEIQQIEHPKHMNEGPGPPVAQKRARNNDMRSGLVDRTRQVMSTERQTQHRTRNTDMRGDLADFAEQDVLEERQTKKRKIAQALVRYRYIKPEPAS